MTKEKIINWETKTKIIVSSNLWSKLVVEIWVKTCKTTSLLTVLDLERQVAEDPGAKGPVRNTVSKKIEFY